MGRRWIRGRSGLANRLVLFGATIIIISLLTAALNPAFSQVHNQSESFADTSQAQTGLSWVETMWQYKTVAGLFLGLVMLIAGAIVESRRDAV